MKLWKVFKAGLKSNNGNIEWKIGEWQKHNGKLVMCQSGFHASERIVDAMQYTNMEQVAQVEVRGESIKQDDKQCWSEMCLLKVYNWTKADSVSLAIYAAELIINLFEKEFPDDKRPRESIEAAKKWLANPSEENRKAAEAAEAAEAAGAAWAAGAAAWAAARATARAAGAAGVAWAADAAAWAAAWAAEAAGAAAWAVGAARNKILDKCEQFILQRLGVTNET